VSCPSREQLGSFLLGTLAENQADYVKFHIESIGCRYCQANLHDLHQQREDTADTTTRRRTKYFQSSAGYLRSDRG
jgi:hypothetical protein